MLRPGSACSSVVFLALLWGCGSSEASPSAPPADPAADGGAAVPADAGPEADVTTAPVDAAAWEDVLVGLGAPFALTVANGRIYFDDAAQGTIESCDEAACTASKRFVKVPGTVLSGTLKTLGNDIVFGTPSGIYRARTATGAIEPLVDRKMTPTAAFVFGDAVYFADKDAPGGGTVERVVPGQAPQILASGVADVRGIHADATDVFFSLYGLDDPTRGSLVYRVSAVSPGGVKVKISGTEQLIAAHDIRVFGDQVHWVGGGGVYRCPRAGCPGPAERLVAETQLSFEGLGGSLADTALVSHSRIVRDTSLATPGVAGRDSDVGTMGQATVTTANYIYIVASSAPGDGKIARRRYRP